MADTHIVNLLKEQRVFHPNPGFSERAHIQSLETYNSTLEDFSVFAKLREEEE
jgi:hypothetical protein